MPCLHFLTSGSFIMPCNLTFTFVIALLKLVLLKS